MPIVNRNVKRNATKNMHPAQSWRDGWDDAANGRQFGHTQNGYQTVRGDSHSQMLYADGYANGSVR